MADVSPVIQELKFKKTFPGLKDDVRYRRFNNCLMHYKGPYYLMTYRLFYPNQGDKRYKDVSRIYHPWSSGWSSDIDTTIIALLEWKRNSFKVIREMDLHWPEKYKPFRHNLQDARIVTLDGKIYVYGQAWVDYYDPISDRVLNQAGSNANVRKCLVDEKEDCSAVVVMLQELNFRTDKNGLPNRVDVMDIRMPCLQHKMINNVRGGMSVEKNWCFFETHGRKYFQYFLHPHTVLSLDCKDKYETPSPLSAIKKYYGCGMFFSPGGPLSPWKKGQLLGVGHVKYQWHCTKFLKFPRKVYKHPRDWGGLVYAMFFYVIEDQPPFRMLHYSNGFIPQYPHQKYALVFPMASVKIQNDLWAIPFGEGDDTPNVFYVTSSQIENRLISSKKKRKPEEFKIDWWESEKFK